MEKRSSLLFVLVLALGFALNSLPVYAFTPSFTISASNAMMPSSGNGAIPFRLTSVDGYTGTVAVSCPGVNAPAGARVPYCGGGPLIAHALTADQAVTGSLVLTPYGVPVPLAAAGALMAGLLLRRRRTAGSTRLALVVACTLAGLGGVAGCGSDNFGMTQGTYTYTITATDIKTNVAVTTTANVTVP
jgi:hypothetical protein